jgi:hypothetical protein
MTVSSDLGREICSLWEACKCAASGFIFNRKLSKVNEECKFGSGVKAKRSKTNGQKTRATCTHNAMINMALTGCCLVTLSLIADIFTYFKGRRKLNAEIIHRLISGNS